MKKLITFASFCFGVLMFTSCASPRGAYMSRSESLSFSSSELRAVKATAAAESSSSASALNSISNSTSGFVIGAYFTGIELSDKFELQPEVDLILVKNLNEIQAPILLKYNIVDKLSALAGPNVGYLLDAPANFKSLNFGVDFGAAYKFTDHFNVNARYGLGLSDLSEVGGTEIKLNGFQIGIGYDF